MVIVIKVEIVNKCQNNIFNDSGNLEDAVINVYYPIDKNKVITVKYNNNIFIPKNDKAIINQNPFDYTFESFIIPKNELIQNEKVEIFYDDEIIGTYNLDYANVTVPNLIQRILNLNNYPSEIQIRFTKPMVIGASDTYFTLNYSKYVSRNCFLDNNKTMLICKNIDIYPLSLYYRTKCNIEEALDFHVYYYQNPTEKISYPSNCFLLSKSKTDIKFYLEYYSPFQTFPIKVYINDREPYEIETLNDKTKRYFYITNNEGNYTFSYLSHDKQYITGRTFYVISLKILILI